MAVKSKNEPTLAYSEPAIRNNLSIVEYCRTSLAAVAGCTAGNIFSRRNYNKSRQTNSFSVFRSFGLNRTVWGPIFYICCHSFLVYVTFQSRN